MAIFGKALISIAALTLAYGSLSAAPLDEASRHTIIQLICNGKDATSVEFYRSRSGKGVQDYSMMREMGFAVLERDALSSEPLVQRLAFFGIGLTADEQAVAFFHEVVKSPNPELQLFALQQLCRYHDIAVLGYLNRAMSSPYILMRLEAAFLLAEGNYPRALSQIEALMSKCPDLILPIFSEMLAQIGSEGAQQILRKQLMHPSQQVRLAAVQAITRHKFDKHVPYIRTLATQRDQAQEEACAFALGVFKDASAAPLLVKISNSAVAETALAASLSLYRLGQTSYQKNISNLANQGNIFAIQALAQCDNAKDDLYQLYQRGDSTIRLNAAVALLSLKDRRAPSMMIDFLSPATPNPPILKVMSPGKSLYCYKTVPLSAYDTPDWDIASELYLQEREQWLQECYNCSETAFLQLAQQLIQRRQNDLIPALFAILQASTSEESLQLIQKLKEIPGYPLVRNYALVALLRKGEKATAYAKLKEWTLEQSKLDILTFRPSLNHLQAFDNEAIQTDLNPSDTAKLFLDSLEALIAEQDEESIQFLLEGLATSHRSLHPIFAALLVRLTQ